MPRTPTPLRRAAGALLLVVAALLVAGCGGDSSEEAAAGGGSTAASNEQDAARLKLQQCLRDQGIDVPEPGQGGGSGGGGGPGRFGGADAEKVQEAMEGPCKDEREGAFGDISEEDRQEFEDARVKFTACLRDQGIDVPDFQPGDGPPAAAQRIDRDDPEVQAAMEKCADLLPRRGRLAPGAGGAR